MVTGCCCCWHPWVLLHKFVLARKPDKLSEKACQLVTSAEGQMQVYMSTSSKPLYFLFPPRSPLNIIVVAGFLRFVSGKCLDCTFTGWHSVFYELCKDIETADTSIWWCELSAAVIELLHLSQGRGEAWPRATVEFSDPAPHASYGTQLLKEAVRFLLVSPLISALTVLMGYNWISNAVGSGCGSHWL